MGVSLLYLGFRQHQLLDVEHIGLCGCVDAFLLHYVPFSAMMVLRGKPRGSLPENGRRLAFNQRA